MKYNGRNNKIHTGIEPSPFKVRVMPTKPLPDSVYYVINSNNTVSIFVTDRIGSPFPVSVPVILPNDFVEKIVSPNNTINITEIGNILQVDIQQSIIDKINDLQSDKHYVHDQSTPSNKWVCNHGLNKNPSVTVTDTTDREVGGSVEYVTKNKVVIDFNYKFSGKAYFN